MSVTQRHSPFSRRIATWRSSEDAPPVPREDDRSELVEALDHAATDGCVVLRVTVERADQAPTEAMKDRLVASDLVVGTSLGRAVGPGAPDTFAILVAPGVDLAAAGRTILDVDGVAGVSAAAFRAGDAPVADDGGPPDVSRDAIHAPLTELPTLSAVQTYAEVVADVATAYLPDGSPPTTAADGASDGDGADERPDGRQRQGPAAAEGEWAAVLEHLEVLSERVRAMELRLSAVDRRMARHDGGTPLAAAAATTNGSAWTTDGGGAVVERELRKRLDGIETTLAEVDRRQRRLEAARPADPT